MPVSSTSRPCPVSLPVVPKAEPACVPEARTYEASTRPKYILYWYVGVTAGGNIFQAHKHSEDRDHYLRIYVQRLRQKIGDDLLHPQYIFTELGIGYRLIESE